MEDEFDYFTDYFLNGKQVDFNTFRNRYVMISTKPESDWVRGYMSSKANTIYCHKCSTWYDDGVCPRCNINDMYIVIRDVKVMENWTPHKLYRKDEAIARATEHAKSYPNVKFYIAKLVTEVEYVKPLEAELKIKELC